MENKINLNDLQIQVNDVITTKTIQVGDNTFELKIRKAIPLEEIVRLALYAAKSATENGEYSPTALDFTLMMEITKAYTNINITEENLYTVYNLNNLGIMDYIKETSNQIDYIYSLSERQAKENIRKSSNMSNITTLVTQMVEVLQAMPTDEAQTSINNIKDSDPSLMNFSAFAEFFNSLNKA